MGIHAESSDVSANMYMYIFLWHTLIVSGYIASLVEVSGVLQVSVQVASTMFWRCVVPRQVRCLPRA